MSLRLTLNFEDIDYSIHISNRFYGSITQLHTSGCKILPTLKTNKLFNCRTKVDYHSVK